MLFAGGLNKDNSPINQQENTYRDALNIVNVSVVGDKISISNEMGTSIFCEFADKNGANDYNVIGFTTLNEEIIVFLVSDDNLRSMIGVVSKAGIFLPMVPNADTPDLNVPNYNTNLTALNLSKDHPVDCVARKLFTGDRVVYFTDNFNPPGQVSLDNVPLENLFENTRLFQFRDFPIIDVERIEQGGQTKCGSYQFAVRYLTENGNATTFGYVSDLVPLFSTDLNNIGTSNIEGGYPDTDANKSIVLKVSNLDQDFTFAEFAVIYYSGFANIRKAGIFERRTITKDTEYVKFDGTLLEEVLESEITEIPPSYTKAKCIEQKDNILFLSNLQDTKEKIDGVQKIINRINVKYEITNLLYSPVDDSVSSSLYITKYPYARHYDNPSDPSLNTLVRLKFNTDLNSDLFSGAPADPKQIFFSIRNTGNGKIYGFKSAPYPAGWVSKVSGSSSYIEIDFSAAEEFSGGVFTGVTFLSEAIPIDNTFEISFSQLETTTNIISSGYLNVEIKDNSEVLYPFTENDSTSSSFIPGYADPKNCFYFRGYMRGEVYSLGVGFVYKDGSRSFVYPIPSSNGKGIPGDISTSVRIPANTTTKQLGTYISIDEYPPNQDYPGNTSPQYDNSFGFTDNRIRHFLMPTVSEEPTTEIIDNSIYLRALGLKFENVLEYTAGVTPDEIEINQKIDELKKEIQGVFFVRERRDIPGNRSIIAQGLANNMVAVQDNFENHNTNKIPSYASAQDLKWWRYPLWNNLKITPASAVEAPLVDGNEVNAGRPLAFDQNMLPKAEPGKIDVGPYQIADEFGAPIPGQFMTTGYIHYVPQGSFTIWNNGNNVFSKPVGGDSWKRNRKAKSSFAFDSPEFLINPELISESGNKILLNRVGITNGVIETNSKTFYASQSKETSMPWWGFRLSARCAFTKTEPLSSQSISDDVDAPENNREIKLKFIIPANTRPDIGSLGYYLYNGNSGYDVINIFQNNKMIDPLNPSFINSWNDVSPSYVYLQTTYYNGSTYDNVIESQSDADESQQHENFNELSTNTEIHVEMKSLTKPYTEDDRPNDDACNIFDNDNFEVENFLFNIKKEIHDQYGTIDDTSYVLTKYFKYESGTTVYNSVFGGDTFISNYQFHFKNLIKNIGVRIDWIGTNYVDYALKMNNTSESPENDITKNKIWLLGDNQKVNYHQIRTLTAVLVETTINCELRHRYVDSDGNLGLPVPGKDADTDVINTEYTGDPNSYNAQYSFENTVNLYVNKPLVFSQADGFYTRTIYSERSFETEAVDSYRSFPINNIYDIPKDTGEIIDTFVHANILFLHTPKCLWRSYVNELTQSTTTSGQITVGSGGIFDVPSRKIYTEKGGYGGTLSQFAGINTPFGYVFPDQLQGKMFILNGESLEDISEKTGMLRFFNDNLLCLPDRKSNYVNESSVYLADNPFTGNGIIACYDFENRRYIMSKLYRVGEGDGIDKSFTISFSLLNGKFVSFHSYRSRYLINFDNVFYGGNNEDNIIYKHNCLTSYKNTPGEVVKYGKYYQDVDSNESMIHYVLNDNPLVEKVADNIVLNMDCFDDITDKIVHLRNNGSDETDSDFIEVFTDKQYSGKTLIQYNNTYGYYAPRNKTKAEFVNNEYRLAIPLNAVKSKFDASVSIFDPTAIDQEMMFRDRIKNKFIHIKLTLNNKMNNFRTAIHYITNIYRQNAR